MTVFISLACSPSSPPRSVLPPTHCRPTGRRVRWGLSSPYHEVPLTHKKDASSTTFPECHRKVKTVTATGTSSPTRRYHGMTLIRHSSPSPSGEEGSGLLRARRRLLLPTLGDPIPLVTSEINVVLWGATHWAPRTPFIAIPSQVQYEKIKVKTYRSTQQILSFLYTTFSSSIKILSTKEGIAVSN